MRNEELVNKGKVICPNLARHKCDEYLEMATSLPTIGLQSVQNDVNGTTGLLVILIGILEHESGSGLIDEAVDVLRRLVGVESKLTT